MPQKDYIVKLAGDSKSYQSAQEQATKALDKFQKQNLSTGAALKTLTSTMSRYIGAAALVKGAQETINKTIQATQASADLYAATMDGLKNGVDTFFTALSSGDFSSFTQGLDQLIIKGAQASKAMDQLSNTVMSFDYLSASNNTRFSESLLTMRNTNATPAERAAARQAAEQALAYAQDLAAGKEAALMDALVKNAVKKSPLKASQFNVDDIVRISQLDALAARPDLLEKYNLQSKNYYLAQADEYAAKIAAARPNLEAIPGDLYRSEAGRAQAAEIEARNNAARAAFNTYEEALQKEYQFSLEVKALLEDISDEELKNNIFSLSTEIANTKQGLVQMERQLLSASGELKRNGANSTAANATQKEPTQRYMSPLEYDRLIAQERLKIAEQYSEDWVALQQQLREIQYQMDVERLTATIQDEEQLAAALRLIEQNKQKDLYNIAMEGYVGRLNLAAQFSEQSESIEESSDNMTASITNMRGALDGISEGGRSIESLGHALTQLSDNKGWQGFGNIVAGAGQAVQAYMQLATAAEIAATAQAATETPTLWGKIAAITAMVGAFASMVSQVRSMSSYAEGGVIPGRNWNDGITARVSSGEMVINEADQTRLYDSIHSGNMGGGGGPAVVTGEQIVLAVNNYGRRTNRGELVFAGR